VIVCDCGLSPSMPAWMQFWIAGGKVEKKS
jgi:hypothetical protein